MKTNNLKSMCWCLLGQTQATTNMIKKILNADMKQETKYEDLNLC